jgi:hypothetical protein
MIIVRIFLFLLGLLLVISTLFSELKTFVLPRSAPDPLTRFVFIFIRRLFNLPLHWIKTYEGRDRLMAYYAPVGLLTLVPAWLVLVMVGYTAMIWAVPASPWDGPGWYHAFRLSGSALFGLGIEPLRGFWLTLLSFSEAAIGLNLVALLIAYLPTMYAAFSRREAAVSLLEVRAGNPPSAAEMILRFNRIHGLPALGDQWRAWETWFADIEESHTSLPALVFFRSPRPDQSWITAAGAVLDTAGLVLSIVDIPNDPQASLCIRAGYLALRRISDYFNLDYNPNPAPTDPISISRAEFDDVVNQLAEKGVPIKADLEQGWRDFNGWRVNYDTVLIALASLTMAPRAPWSSDRIISPVINVPIWRNKSRSN